MTDLPIACTLEPAEMRERATSIDALLRDAMLNQTAIPGGLCTHFRDDAEVERRIRELAEAESRCCGFLTFEIGRDDDGLFLAITGDAEARPVIEDFFASRA